MSNGYQCHRPYGQCVFSVCGVCQNIEIMNERCRICLKYQQDVISLLLRKDLGTDLTIADQINSFCQVDVLQHGSKMICLKCAEKSYTAYKFLQDCIRSTEILLEEFKMLNIPKEYIVRPDFEDPECVIIESNCNLEPEIEIDVFRPELEEADTNISIEEFSWDHKPEIQAEKSSTYPTCKPAVHDAVAEKIASNMHKRRNIIRVAPILSCEYCPKKYTRRPAYLVHLNKHRENNDTVEQSTKPKRLESSNSPEILSKGNATLDEQTGPLKDQNVSLHSRNWMKTSQTAANAENTAIKTTPKVPGFSCRFCLHVSKSRRSHSIHERTHRAPYACRFCDQVQQTLKELMQHQRELHISEARFICDTCGKVFFHEKNLQLHENTHAGIKPYMCDICGCAFTVSRNLVNHLRTHTGEKRYTCFQCGKAFATTTSLRNHEDVHNVEKKYTCEICGVKFFRADGLRQHRREKHPDQNAVFPCEFCPKQFPARSLLRKHTRIHTAEPRHVCGTCGKRFLKRWNCKVHERMHTKERPYKCELCDKTFTQAHCMRSHMTLHRKKDSSQNATLLAKDLQEGEPTADSGPQEDVRST